MFSVGSGYTTYLAVYRITLLTERWEPEEADDLIRRIWMYGCCCVCRISNPRRYSAFMIMSSINSLRLGQHGMANIYAKV